MSAAPYYDPDTYKFDERNFRFGILVLYRISMILASLHCRCSGLTLRCRSCPGGCSIPGSWSPPPRPRSSTARCELCAPGHMPTEGGSFVSCREFCHGHTDTCVQEAEGYTCVDCGNWTTGARLDTGAAPGPCCYPASSATVTATATRVTRTRAETARVATTRPRRRAAAPRDARADAPRASSTSSGTRAAATAATAP